MEIRTIKTFDHYRLLYRYWDVPSPRGVVICLHGVQSHSEWFARSCQYLADRGYRVYAPDRRGSGMNNAQRGDCPWYQAFLFDVRLFVDIEQKMSPRMPVHLMGVSWGGKLAAMTAIQYPAGIRSVILIAPGLAEKVDLPFREKLRVAAARLIAPTRLFRIPIDPKMFTANPERIAYIGGDRCMLKMATARFLVESRRMSGYVRHNAGKLETPVMMMLAGIDDIVDNDRLIELFKRFGAWKKGFKIYADAYHTIEFERDNEKFFNDIAEWCDQFPAPERW
ncbi:MAG TPA: alpha/beta fold hydrolase [bacterium]|nr:alpha/beta fold hydrolase [bacterium]